MISLDYHIHQSVYSRIFVRSVLVLKYEYIYHIQIYFKYNTKSTTHTPFKTHISYQINLLLDHFFVMYLDLYQLLIPLQIF